MSGKRRQEETGDQVEGTKLELWLAKTQVTKLEALGEVHETKPRITQRGKIPAKVIINQWPFGSDRIPEC